MAGVLQGSLSLTLPTSIDTQIFITHYLGPCTSFIMCSPPSGHFPPFLPPPTPVHLHTVQLTFWKFRVNQVGPQPEALGSSVLRRQRWRPGLQGAGSCHALSFLSHAPAEPEPPAPAVQVPELWFVPLPCPGHLSYTLPLTFQNAPQYLLPTCCAKPGLALWGCEYSPRVGLSCLWVDRSPFISP